MNSSFIRLITNSKLFLSFSFLLLGVIIYLLFFLQPDIPEYSDLQKFALFISFIAFLSGIFFRGSFSFEINMSEKDENLIKEFITVGKALKEKRLNIELLKTSELDGKTITTLRNQLDSVTKETERLNNVILEKDKSYNQLNLTFENYKSSFPDDSNSEDCDVIRRVLILRTQRLQKLIDARVTGFNSHVTQKKILDTLMLVLRGHIPKGRSGSDYNIQQDMGKEIWGICRDQWKQDDKKSVPTDWQDHTSTVSSSGDKEIEGMSPKINLNMIDRD